MSVCGCLEYPQCLTPRPSLLKFHPILFLQGEVLEVFPYAGEGASLGLFFVVGPSEGRFKKKVLGEQNEARTSKS